jgi:hypothetical protein
MVIVGRRPEYRCDASRGNGGVCDNRQTVREEDLRAAIVDKVVGHFGSEEVAEAILEEAHMELRASRATAATETDSSARELDATEQKISRLVDMVADGTAPPSIVDRLRELEEAAKGQRSRLSSLRSVARLEPRLPTAREIVRRVQAIGLMVEADPADARLALQRLFPDGIRLEPQPDGSYRAEWQLNPEALFAAKTKAPPGSPREAQWSAYAVGCGDAQGTAYRSVIPGFAVIRRSP